MWRPKIEILILWTVLLLQNFLSAFRLCLGYPGIVKIYFKNIFRLSYGSFWWIESLSQNSIFSAPTSIQYWCKWLKKGFDGNHATQKKIHRIAKNILQYIFDILISLRHHSKALKNLGSCKTIYRIRILVKGLHQRIFTFSRNIPNFVKWTPNAKILQWGVLT